MNIQNKTKKLRFVLVGGVNTAIDFGLLFGLRALGLPQITANTLSTTLAFCFSFFANKKFTFKTTDTNIKREILLFVVFTLFGLWVLQNGVIIIATNLLSPFHLPEPVSLFIAKVAATVVSLVWNYVTYSRFVFKQPNKG